MDSDQVHYELFVRRKPGADWTLDLASESRSHAVDAAEERLKAGVIAVRVTKETLDPETREFKTITILTKGDVSSGKVKKVREDVGPLCITPQDLYTSHARERIARLLENWLLRQRATPFELLHRPDLVEKLEASGVDLQHAIQKVAIPEAQARGLTVHELIRTLQSLVERSIERVLKDGRQGKVPDLRKESFASLIQRIQSNPDHHYLLGLAIAGALSRASDWRDKVVVLLDLADAAPADPKCRALAIKVLEEPLTEILASDAGLSELLGQGLDLGDMLAAMARIAGAEAVEALIAMEPRVAAMMPILSGPAARLANWLDGPHFEGARAAVARRVLRELNGPRRLKPSDAEAEIANLRALAMALTASAGRILTLDEVQSAFTNRSRMLVAGNFVEDLVGEDRTPRQEAEVLIRLVENVTGAANKREAARWLATTVGTLRFERDFRHGSDSPSTRLATLATLQRNIARSGLVPEDFEPIQAALGEIGGALEGEARVVAAITKAPAPPMQRLTLLMRLAAGEVAPMGPAADRARQEVMKMLRLIEVRESLATMPEMLEKLRRMMQSSGAMAA
jgi:hypothetical protein